MAAWGITSGSREVHVGVIDSGIASHSDLNMNTTEGWDFFNNNAVTTDDTNGHGTKVAGIIGAIGNNQTGISGIARHVTPVPLQTINNSGLHTATDGVGDLRNLI